MGRMTACLNWRFHCLRAGLNAKMERAHGVTETGWDALAYELTFVSQTTDV